MGNVHGALPLSKPRHLMGPALVVGASGGVGGALYSFLSKERRVVAVSSQARKGRDWFETDYSEDSLKQIADNMDSRFSLVFICGGFLHGEGVMPEKRLIDLSPRAMEMAFRKNAITPSMILKHFRAHFEQIRPAHCAVLSARIGSIGDNRSGGWYSYRSSKAALNMIVKSTAIELKRTHKELCLVAMHPGTTESKLSDPFLKRGTHPSVKAEVTARRLLDVVSGLGPEDSGGFFDWQGQNVEW